MDSSFEREEKRLHGKVEQETDDFEKDEHGGEVHSSFEMDEESH